MSKKRQPPTTAKPRSTTRIDDSDLYAPGRYLPECDGPKLGLFKDYRANIEWCEMLGPVEDPNDSDDTDSGTADGYVFRTVINSKQYAIKVFKFYDPRNGSGFWKPLLGKNASLIKVGWFSDPFYSECRAYGKMQGSKSVRTKSARIAVPCHGYILLREQDTEILRRRGIDLDIANLDYQRQTTEKCKVRAIVKDLASSQSGVNDLSLPRIISGICYLNAQGILNADIRLDNFRDGRLVDFGSSWTKPHAMLDAMDQNERRKSWRLDRLLFDAMLKREFDGCSDKFKIHAMKRRSQIFIYLFIYVYTNDAVSYAAGRYVEQWLRQEETVFENEARDTYFANNYVHTDPNGAIWDSFEDVEDDLEEWKVNRVALIKQYRRDIAQRRETLKVKPQEELLFTTERDVEEFKQLQERMITETAADKAEAAAKEKEEAGSIEVAEDGTDIDSLESACVVVADMYASMDCCEFFEPDL